MRKIYIPTELVCNVEFDTKAIKEVDANGHFVKYKVDHAIIYIYLHDNTQAYKDWFEYNYSADANGRWPATEERDYVMFYRGSYFRFKGIFNFGDRIFSTKNTWEVSDIHETLEEKVERLEKEIEDLNASKTWLHNELKLKADKK